MKKLAVFLVAAYLVFNASYMLSEPESFWGGKEPERKDEVLPEVEESLVRFGSEMAQFYATGNEADLQQVLADPGAEESPIRAWQADRHWLLAMDAGTELRVVRRRVVDLSGRGGVLLAGAREEWEVRGRRHEVSVRYELVRQDGGLRVAREEVAP